MNLAQTLDALEGLAGQLGLPGGMDGRPWRGRWMKPKAALRRDDAYPQELIRPKKRLLAVT